GRSENAVKTQIRIAVSVYVLVAIIKKRLKIETSLYNILPVLSLTLFEKIPLFQLLDNSNNNPMFIDESIQLNLFDNFLGH
ncbi:MAG: IS4 family transposase, partial [Candidatus Marinimicrobia bacterium]|nr:IS4 family transposase [Candidatus Neomarinimicrobiota bacterium]